MPTGHGRGGGGFAPHVPSIFQLLAGALAFLLVPGFKHLWTDILRLPLPQAAESFLPGFVAALILAGAAYGLSKPVAFRIAGTLGARGDKLAIYVARLGPTEDGLTAQARVIASIRKELGESVQILSAADDLSYGVTDDSLAEDARRAGRLLLKKKHGDLLIWGKALMMQEMKPRLDIRFVSAQLEWERPESTYGFNEHFTVDDDFKSAVNIILTFIIDTIGHNAEGIDRFSKWLPGNVYSVQTLSRLASKVAPLVHNRPPAMATEFYVLLVFSYLGILHKIVTVSDAVAPLDEGIKVGRELIKTPPMDSTDGWISGLRYLLAIALSRLGEQNADTALLRESIELHREVLTACDREHYPEDWCKDRANLGLALRSLGRTQLDTDLLVAACVAFKEALEEEKRISLPKWDTQLSLGLALIDLGNREMKQARFHEAAASFGEALNDIDKQRFGDRAEVHYNLGSVWVSVGKFRQGEIEIRRSVKDYRAATIQFSRKRLPLKWATMQASLGVALTSLGESGLASGGTINRAVAIIRYHAAVKAFRKALDEQTQTLVPLRWAETHVNLGRALTGLADGYRGHYFLFQAERAFRAALEVQTKEKVARAWVSTGSRLGKVLLLLGERNGNVAHLVEAVDTFREVLEERSIQCWPFEWAETWTNLGRALVALGEREESTSRIEEALTALREAVTILSRAEPGCHMAKISLSQAQDQMNRATRILEAKKPAQRKSDG
jgi:tetratricopeptide (TPR) repeat protein